MKRITTSNGFNLILRGLAGAKIEFTKIKLGNGAEQGEDAVDLSNPIMELPITSITRADKYITLETSYKNADVPTDFSAQEIGVFAKDPDDDTKDILYCSWYEEDPVKADYISAVEDRILGTKFEVLVFVDAVEDVTAVLAESSEFATKAALTQHVNDKGNPHKVSATDVGLGNVPNVTPENQQPVFDEEIGPISVSMERDPNTNLLTRRVTSFPNIEKGDLLGAMIKKIRTGFSVVLSHINGTNPHGISATSIGAAAQTHYHSATQINSGTLGIKRGGTGADTAEKARFNLGIQSGQCTAEIKKGEVLFFKCDYPTAFSRVPMVVVTPLLGASKGLELGIYSMSAIGFTVFIYSPTYSGPVNFNWIACL